MAYTDRSPFLEFLYETAVGRTVLKAVSNPGLSRRVGKFLDSPASARIVPKFAKKNGIDLSQCVKSEFLSFNDFFTRQLKPELRPCDMAENALVSPCDGRLTVFPIAGRDTSFQVKGSAYTVEALLQNSELAQLYCGGLCLLFRLCVDDYHRYHYLDSGAKGDNHFIPGVLHTVRPIALRNVPVFLENSREYTTLRTDHFGLVTQVEVGALLVGKIQNHQGAGTFQKGQEKGMFLFGGSSILVLLEPGKVDLRPELLSCEIEHRVRCGERLGIVKTR